MMESSAASPTQSAATSPSSGPQYQPLYKQVQQLITQYIIEGRWKAGEMLPSEFQLADLFGVSQGTVRKALNAMTDEHILFRRQGVGTFVSEHTLQQTLFHFFHIVADGGTPELPNAQLRGMSKIAADQRIAAALNLTEGSPVIRIDRLRAMHGKPCIREEILLPHALFGDLHLLPELPHSLYHFYQQQYQVNVHKACDRIKADLANADDAAALDIPPGAPVLVVERIAKALDGKPVEYRTSRVRSDDFHYLVELN
ncbi:GntR family transcriptional regulator [Pokkaliibacter plantistimulans]|nr:GntR family transcriptional regulator [Pokkaliibacter plantistimulans]